MLPERAVFPLEQVDGFRCGEVVACFDFLAEMRRDRVRTRNDRRKLSFGAGVSLHELSVFVAHARRDLGLDIKTDLFREREASYR